MKKQTKQIYNLTQAEIFKKFSVKPEGLSQEEVQSRLLKFGKNKIFRKHNWHRLRLIGNQFNDTLVWILAVAALMSIFFGEKQDAVIIVVIILVNAIIGFFQEFRAERILENIRKLTRDTAVVIRGGKKEEIETVGIVPGDVVFVSSGENIAADGYLIESFEFKVNSFIFTGESKPKRKLSHIITEKDIHLADIDNMVFMGETVATGEAKFVVTSIGMETELGHIATLSREIKDDLTPLQKQIRVLGKNVTIASVLIAVTVIAFGFYSGMSLYRNFLFALALAVSVVPEGLPATMSVALSFGLKKLLSKNVLAKKLNAVETLGSVSIICTDKTGTITRNELTVTKIIVDDKIIEVEGEGYEPKGNFHIEGKPIHLTSVDNLELILKIGTLCNDAALIEEDGSYKILGDPTEGAIIVAGKKYNPKENFYRLGEKKIDELPFTSERMRMSVIYESNEVFSFIKGSPDTIIDLCDYKKIGNKILPFTAEEKQNAKKTYDKMSAEALRVLAFAYRNLDDFPREHYKAEAEKELIWVGMMAMMDPPRKDVAEAIKECRQFGIRPVMITGDYELTAKAIAREVGLIGDREGTFAIINGKLLEKMTDAEIYRTIKKKDTVFARIDPSQKLKIATILKKYGEVIAMTGDGVNDAPALKRADIGVAMGIMGTDVSKEAADMILLDDNFHSIIRGIKIGRTIYQNIKKIIYYDFTSNASALFTVILGVILRLPAPISAIQILAIDLGTDVFPCFALGLEPADPDVAKYKNDKNNRNLVRFGGILRIIYIGLIMAVGAVVAFFWSMSRGGWHWGAPISENALLYIKSTSAAYAVLAMTQMANLVQIRSERYSPLKIGFFKNIYLIFSIFLSIILLFIFMYLPAISHYVRMRPIDWQDWIVVIIFTLAVFIFEEIRKARLKK